MVYKRDRILKNPVRKKQLEAREKRRQDRQESIEKRKVWTAEKNKLLRDLWALGRPAEVIGKHLGVSTIAVWHQAEKLGMKRRPRIYRSNETRKANILVAAKQNGHWVQPPSWKDTRTGMLIEELVAEGKLEVTRTTRDGCVHLSPVDKL